MRQIEIKTLIFGALIGTVLTVGCSDGGYEYRSPKELADVALSDASHQTRRTAALDLSRHPDKEETAVELRRVLRDSNDPGIQALAVSGVTRLDDWDSMPLLLDALESDSEELRGRAIVGVNKMLGLDYHFRASDSPENQTKRIAAMRQVYEEMNKHFPTQN